ncbi:MAG TPA: 16S rRNA (adenine(1518)-N(6)/adenine(1519)-N(6))-dimethyltransferase RsmA [candidate division Zixibacteria bacterium]|nr:16S rRNA (adenine(1518)-N(6)/adenine(1519)-N(6))-dimethyltransferase RsmA [candidate division Zixibacteria bacterium]
MNDLIAEIRDALIQAGISPKKALSQNFMVNSDILHRQLSYAEITDEDIVLEIGAGTGILTKRLAEKAGKIFSIEYDKQLVQYLNNLFKNNEKVTIISGDILKLDLPKVNKVVANIPYHISSPITFKLLDLDIDLAVLMYQLEFANRMIAKPGTSDYSRLSVNVQYEANVEILEKVSKGNFYPPPKVDSAIVKIIPKKEKLPVEVKYFRIITRLLFNTKNKLVTAVLYEFFKKKIKKEKRFEMKNLIDTNITHSNIRVRELTNEELIQITSELVSILEREKLAHLLPTK